MEKLAIEGGMPVRKQYIPERIMFDEREKKAALRVIEKTMNGPQALDRYGGVEVDAYEKEFADYFGVKFATAVSSGTAAIHSAIAALHLEPGSEIITTPITDPGTVSPILFQQCIPVFADVEYETLNISPSSIERNITEKTRAVIVVHLAGSPARIDEIVKIAKRHKIYVIEDCAQAHGAKYKGRYVGTFGDMGAFSLMSGKHTTSGGQGGMVITNNEKFYWDAKRFADRGKPFNSNETTNLFAGLNYRMTELEAAIGRVQLKKLGKIQRKRMWVYKELQKGFEENLSCFRLWKISQHSEPNPWFCFVWMDKEKIMVDKSEVAKALSAEYISVGAHYVIPMYKQKWLVERNTFGNSHLPWSLPGIRDIIYEGSCPEAERTLDDHMTLYIHEGWKKREIIDTIKAFLKVERRYKKCS
ncbi:MAG: DegT/DnrJ/EryC1/StrS family aminotransferase [Candidatus Ratteibacteria bacterium]|nr:DegT/DnrJ/EryC1/StrS family aminotransferase [Candidatus Ratteibacteria bacterium]